NGHMHPWRSAVDLLRDDPDHLTVVLPDPRLSDPVANRADEFVQIGEDGRQTPLHRRRTLEHEDHIEPHRPFDLRAIQPRRPSHARDGPNPRPLLALVARVDRGTLTLRSARHRPLRYRHTSHTARDPAHAATTIATTSSTTATTSSTPPV